MMTICALIPAFNEAAHIAQVVEGARPYVESVIVIDDGSSDGTAELARKAGAFCIDALSGAENKAPPLVYFMTIDNAKFRKPVVPGDRVEFHIERTNRRRNMWWFKGRALVDGQLVCEAEFSAMLVDKPVA